jgi:hypothetical protein
VRNGRDDRLRTVLLPSSSSDFDSLLLAEIFDRNHLRIEENLHTCRLDVGKQVPHDLCPVATHWPRISPFDALLEARIFRRLLFKRRTGSDFGGTSEGDESRVRVELREEERGDGGVGGSGGRGREGVLGGVGEKGGSVFFAEDAVRAVDQSLRRFGDVDVLFVGNVSVEKGEGEGSGGGRTMESSSVMSFAAGLPSLKPWIIEQPRSTASGVWLEV